MDQGRETDRAPKVPEAVGAREAAREDAAATVARERPGARTASNPGKLSATSAHRLQAAAGNRAVARLVAQRRAASGPPGGGPGPAGPAAAPAPTARADQAAPGAPGPVVEGGDAVVARAGAAGTQLAPAPPAPPPGGGGGGGGTPVVQRLDDGGDGEGRNPDPQADPKFVRLTQDVKAKGDRMAAHPPAQGEAAKAQAAARPPADDREAQGKAANAEKMNAAKPGTFDKAGFIRAVNDAIAAQAPKNLDEADTFGESGKAAAVKGAVQGQVSEGKKASAGEIERTTNAPPDTSAAREKQVTPLVGDKPPGAPAPPDPNLAVPDKLPPSATDLSSGPAQVDQQMADADVTEDQLARSNEPEFTGALKEKKEAEAHSETAPPQMRAAESATLGDAKAAAQAEGAAAMRSFAGDRAQAGDAVHAGKQEAQTGDEGKHKQVNAKLQAVFNRTQTDVQGILTELDRKVDDTFTQGEKGARDAFTADHKQRMDRYKEARYSGLLGKGRWLKDKFAGLPAEANQIFEQAKAGYTRRMQGVIETVADLIGNELTRAKGRIAQGREELAAEVQRLPVELQAVAKDAVGSFNAKFDELSQSVDEKSDELVNTLATRYSDAMKAVDDEIAAEKEKNKGFVAKAVDAVKGAIETILKLKDLLMGVLAKAVSAVAAIIKDPIKFLGNLVSALGAGLKAFIANIGKHLSAGLMGFLLGAMAATGVLMPSKFDIQGLIMLVAGIMGLTWAALRGRIVRKGVPDQAMTQVERVMPMAQKMQTGGVGGVWQDIKGKVGDLKGMLFSKISEYLIPTVLIAGITWILSLLNPASAFIKACKMIVDIISFIITRGAQIATFVNAVLDAVIAIAGGALGSVPGLIEGALARSVPVLIGALAAILGIGGIAQKIQSFVKALAKPVGKAIDWVVDKIASFGKKLWAKIRSKFSKKDGKKDGKKDDSKKDPRIRELVTADVNAALPDGVQDSKVQPAVRSIMAKRRKQGLDMLEVRKTGTPGQFDIYMAASPVTKIRTTKVDPRDPVARQLVDDQGNVYAEFTFAVPRNVVLAGSFHLPVSGKPVGFGETNAIGELHTPSRVTSYPKKTSKSDAVHAEDLLIAEVKGTWDASVGPVAEETPSGEAKPRATLQVKVTRTPCGRCAQRLGALRSWASGKGWHLDVDVQSISLYQGKQEGEDPQGKTVTVRGVAGGQQGLLRLAEWGIRVRPMGPDDPTIKDELAKLPPQDQVALAQKILDCNRKLDAAIQAIAAVPIVLRNI